MIAIGAIAHNTFREAIRDRVLYLLLFFALLVIAGSEAVAVLAVGDPAKVVLDLGLAAISFFGVLISVFLGLAVVSKEIDRRTVYTVVSKPLSRSAFVVGKVVGLYAVVVVVVLAMAAFFLGFVWLRYGVGPRLLLAPILLSLVEDWVVACLAVLFSCFTTPILGTLFSLTLYVIGHLSVGLKMLADFEAMRGTLGSQLLIAGYYLLPNLERFNVRDAAVHGEAVTLSWVVGAGAYGLCYGAAVLLLATRVFSRRDFV